MEEGRQAARERKEKRHHRAMWRQLTTAVAAIVILTLAGSAAFIAIVPLNPGATGTPSQVYDANGDLIGSLQPVDRTVIPGEDIPQAMRDAIVSIEDERFYQHIGVDPIGIARAVVANIAHREVVQGGSTITQQLARNLYLSTEQTLGRKAKEAVLALRLERTYSKTEILNLYLNNIYFGIAHGSSVYGIENAALSYFGKHAKDMTVAECATLAGIPRNPGYYSPLDNPDASRSRRNLILDRMAQFGYVTAEQASAAKNAPLKVVSANQARDRTASYYLNAVFNDIKSRYANGVDLAYRGGLKIYTGLDLKMQQAAETAVARLPQFSNDEAGVRQPQIALVAIDPQNGYVKAYVGGRDFRETQYDRVVDAKRQPGSAFKVFLYSAAIDSRQYTAASRMMCSAEGAVFPQSGGRPPYKPTDFEAPYHNRELTFREALAQSDNVIAVKLNNAMGPDLLARYAKTMGINSPLTANLPLALGASDVTPLEITTAYCTIANGGYRLQPIFVTKIVDSNGRTLEENTPKKEKVLDEKTAYVVTSMMKSVIEPGGTASAGNIGRPAAGKTGTSDEFRDAWFIGFTPQLVAGVYVGDDLKQPLKQTGGTLTSPIWASFMKAAVANFPAVDFTMPSGIKTAWIDPATGYLATPYCPNARTEVYIAGTEPTLDCPVHPAPTQPTPAPLIPGLPGWPKLPNILDWFR